MITKIEIHGFKTFREFSLELEPFHFIIGRNASGKSNLFDAMKLLGRLAKYEVSIALKSDRGREREQFTQLGNGEFVKRMKLAVELLLDKEVVDSYGEKSTLKYTRLRYEVTVQREDDQGIEKLVITNEKLSRINKPDDAWYNKHMNRGSGSEYWLPDYQGGSQNLIFKGVPRGSKIPVFVLRGEGDASKQRRIQSGAIQKTILSGITGVEYPHAYAVKQELISWSFLHLNPDEIRKPSSIYEQPVLASDGSNLAAVLNNLYQEDKYFLRDISRDLSNLIPGIIDIYTEINRSQELIEVKARSEDGKIFPLPLLSEGTLRLLALVTFKHNLLNSQVLFLEEPENGVHASRLRDLLKLLTSMVTNFSSKFAQEYPLRQIVINTHSPRLIQILGDEVVEVGKQLPGIAIAEKVTNLNPTRDSKIQITKIDNVPIIYEGVPRYDTQPNHLISKIERLLNTDQI